MIEMMVTYALSFSGTPYMWGGNNPIEGFDCSGYVQEVLASIGIDPPGDQTAQQLYNYFIAKEYPTILNAGSILFFGKDDRTIKHVAIAVNRKQMISASGGGRHIRNYDDARRAGAFVKIRLIKTRSDLVTYFYPKEL